MASLSQAERETVVSFDESSPEAVIFTYNRAWQQHLEKNLGLTPAMDNGFGGREYTIDKSRIRPPRAPVRLSEARRRALADSMRERARGRKAGSPS